MTANVALLRVRLLVLSASALRLSSSSLLSLSCSAFSLSASMIRLMRRFADCCLILAVKSARSGRSPVYSVPRISSTFLCAFNSLFMLEDGRCKIGPADWDLFLQSRTSPSRVSASNAETSILVATWAVVSIISSSFKFGYLMLALPNDCKNWSRRKLLFLLLLYQAVNLAASREVLLLLKWSVALLGNSRPSLENPLTCPW